MAIKRDRKWLNYYFCYVLCIDFFLQLPNDFFEWLIRFLLAKPTVNHFRMNKISFPIKNIGGNEVTRTTFFTGELNINPVAISLGRLADVLKVIVVGD
ncbi:hypothetical protein SAMN04488095_3130 [Jannaschia pohangensis]|uniref:Uncharacterized protein n=1 Tax=Jannaschia pohangensis TaxID=390807 RepID=A0A1I3SEU0_9RHOB|nr:hypothetical protein SAMN04488095_3130 [Jannaschia pohangensis]